MAELWQATLTILKGVFVMRTRNLHVSALANINKNAVAYNSDELKMAKIGETVKGAAIILGMTNPKAVSGVISVNDAFLELSKLFAKKNADGSYALAWDSTQCIDLVEAIMASIPYNLAFQDVQNGNTKGNVNSNYKTNTATWEKNRLANTDETKALIINWPTTNRGGFNELLIDKHSSDMFRAIINQGLHPTRENVIQWCALGSVFCRLGEGIIDVLGGTSQLDSGFMMKVGIVDEARIAARKTSWEEAQNGEERKIIKDEVVAARNTEPGAKNPKTTFKSGLAEVMEQAIEYFNDPKQLSILQVLPEVNDKEIDETVILTDREEEIVKVILNTDSVVRVINQSVNALQYKNITGKGDQYWSKVNSNNARTREAKEFSREYLLSELKASDLEPSSMELAVCINKSGHYNLTESGELTLSNYYRAIDYMESFELLYIQGTIASEYPLNPLTDLPVPGTSIVLTNGYGGGITVEGNYSGIATVSEDGKKLVGVHYVDVDVDPVENIMFHIPGDELGIPALVPDWGTEDRGELDIFVRDSFYNTTIFMDRIVIGESTITIDGQKRMVTRVESLLGIAVAIYYSDEEVVTEETEKTTDEEVTQTQETIVTDTSEETDIEPETEEDMSIELEDDDTDTDTDEEELDFDMSSFE